MRAQLILAGFVSLMAFPAFAQDAVAPAPAAETPAVTKTAKLNEASAGDLLLTPARVVLEGRKRTENVILNNRGGKEATYRVTLLHKRMLEDGNYQDIDEKNPAKPGEQFADDMVRYSPRQVTLKPGESQTVKFMMRAPEGTAPGEYRSHILFNAVPDMSKGADLGQSEEDKTKLSVRLVPVYGISIPLIVRAGDLTATASISDASLAGDKVSITLNRQGTKSLYGDVFATNSAGKVVGQINGIAVFTPNEKRKLTFKLSEPASAADLTISYRERQEDGGKTIAEAKVRG